MPLFQDTQTWKLQTLEVAYKDPFSEDTHRIRRKALFFAFVAILSHYFPVNLEKSHVLGVVFSEGTAPPLDGLVGLLVIFFTVELVIYSAQEIVSWIAQAKESYFSQLTSKLEEVTTRNTELVSVVTSTKNWLEEVALVVSAAPAIDGVRDDEHSELAAIKRKLSSDAKSAEKWVSDLGRHCKQYQERVDEAAAYLAAVQKGVQRAVRFQLLRVGLVQLSFPLLILTWAIYQASPAAFQLLAKILQ